MDRVDVNTLVDVKGSKLRGERLNFLRYTAIKTDSHEHICLSVEFVVGGLRRCLSLRDTIGCVFKPAYKFTKTY